MRYALALAAALLSMPALAADPIAEADALSTEFEGLQRRAYAGELSTTENELAMACAQTAMRTTQNLAQDRKAGRISVDKAGDGVAAARVKFHNCLSRYGIELE